MIVIRKRSVVKKYCYGGSGIFMNIGKKLFTRGLLKKAINTAAKSTIAQKVSDAVVNGATAATQKATERALTEAVNIISKRNVHVPELSTTTSKKPKLDINSLIDGTGIVFD